MRILLINPPHPSIGSRIPHEHLPPLGLLAIGGPLLDAGHSVRLLDAEFGPMRPTAIADQAWNYAPEAVLIGHSGSTSGHPSVVEVTRAIRKALPQTWLIYGGVYPTYHWPEIMAQEPQIDLIVRGEGEETAVRLLEAIQAGSPLSQVAGIVHRPHCRPCPGEAHKAYRAAGQATTTAPRELILDLDEYRVGWELIEHKRYSYWGNRRAVVVQFSRGCPHRCNYCGQRSFWGRWRHRDPVKFAAELARLHREHGVEVINFADENPTASRVAWRAFLEALIAENVRLILVGSTRADDIVRDADILQLYKRAGVARFLLGIESTDEKTLGKIRKDSQRETDREAICLLRRHGILSMAAFVAGFEEETDRDYWRLLRQILRYDPDQIQALYATPHRWTPYFRTAGERRVIQLDLRRWDYKHQVLGTAEMPPWRILFWMKLIEAVAQLRPKSLWRLWAHPDSGLRAAMRWYCQIGRQVWPYEVWNFVFRDERRRNGPTVAEFLGAPAEEQKPSGIKRRNVAYTSGPGRLHSQDALAQTNALGPRMAAPPSCAA